MSFEMIARSLYKMSIEENSSIDYADSRTDSYEPFPVAVEQIERCTTSHL
jgi:hypothetical protein